jgi:hypothetical protein
VPEAQALLAQPPAQQDLFLAAFAGEVDQARVHVLHLAAQLLDPGQLLTQSFIVRTEEALGLTHVQRLARIILVQQVAGQAHARPLQGLLLLPERRPQLQDVDEDPFEGGDEALDLGHREVPPGHARNLHQKGATHLC